MTGAAGPFGEPPHQWRIEWWLCKKCGKKKSMSSLDEMGIFRN
jgi:hypothetical protein